MPLLSLSVLALAAGLRFITFAMPLAEPQVLPRDHVQCDAETRVCQVQRTCDNAPSIIAGTVPDPWPSSIATLVNPVPALATSVTGAGEVSSTRKYKSRQNSPVEWCALGTEIYIILALQGTDGAAAIQKTLATAIQGLETQMGVQTANQSEMGIKAGSAPLYNFAGAAKSNVKITVENAARVNMTWVELELGLLTIADWMDSNTYGWGSASVWDGANEVGMIYITA